MDIVYSNYAYHKIELLISINWQNDGHRDFELGISIKRISDIYISFTLSDIHIQIMNNHEQLWISLFQCMNITFWNYS